MIEPIKIISNINLIKNNTVNNTKNPYQINNSSTANAVKRKRKEAEVHITPLPQIVNVRNAISSCVQNNDFEPSWMIITDLPHTTSANDMREFFNGLKIQEIYGYYNHIDKKYSNNNDNNSKNLSSVQYLSQEEEKVYTCTLEVYVQFESPSGVDAGMLRNGENIIILAELQNKKKDIKANKSGVKNCIAASLSRISKVKASWAKAICIKLDNQAGICMKKIDIIQNLFSSLLLSISPSIAIKKWEFYVPSNIYPSANEICSYLDYEKKSNNKLQVSRYDSHIDRGFYIDVHKMNGGISYTGMSGISFNNSDNIMKKNSFYKKNDIYSYSLTNINYMKGINVNNDSQNHCSNDNDKVSDDNAYQEITSILNELSIIMSETLLESYSMLQYTEKDLIDKAINDSILDLIHRMSSMYQFIHSYLKNKTYLYSKSLETVRI